MLKARFTLLREVLKETYAGGEGQPSAFDIALSMPEVRAAINVPVEVQLDKTAFEFLQNTSALSEFATQWRKDQEAALTRIVERITDTLPPGADVLSLAVARFMCVRCETRLANLRVLSHCCLGDAFEGGLHVNGTTDVYRRAALRAFAQTPRSMPEHMVVADVEAMLLVLPIAGLYDVRRDVVKPPSEDPLRLACKACKPKRGVAVMTWASAVSKHRFLYFLRVRRLIDTVRLAASPRASQALPVPRALRGTVHAGGRGHRAGTTRHGKDAPGPPGKGRIGGCRAASGRRHSCGIRAVGENEGGDVGLEQRDGGSPRKRKSSFLPVHSTATGYPCGQRACSRQCWWRSRVIKAPSLCI